MDEECKWDNDDDNFEDDRTFYTECHNEFILNDGDPISNGMKFCCYCGKRITKSE